MGYARKVTKNMLAKEITIARPHVMKPGNMPRKALSKIKLLSRYGKKSIGIIILGIIPGNCRKSGETFSILLIS
jgi:hypothetical protein